MSKARAAFEDGRWSRMRPSARKDILARFATLVTRNAQELAVMESLDSGKTIFDCETVDIPETILCIKWHAEVSDKIYDQVAPASDDPIALVVRVPIGVVRLVLPWNFPLLVLAWKIGPALATGCSVVVKPDAWPFVQRCKFDARFPRMAGMRMAHEWAGHLCRSLTRRRLREKVTTPKVKISINLAPNAAAR